ncbi:hypothetical protein [Parvularcula maris]|uniref:Uncharacterized protein n=1 Tax=Parvularcula maris TaxID=2965077 RepID=A0A9X2LAI8_9PROT|nr:hypothetical protein [Parvularcula maris]MCQ8185017.1 hypothetical protein [Parvularcula maris]
MIRIVFPLAMAAAAFFGIWSGGVSGQELAGPTLSCLIDVALSSGSGCLPDGPIAESLVTYTILGGVAAALLSVLGLIRFVGRLTSVAVLAAGAIGLGASGMAAIATFGAGTPPMEVWGVWATLAGAVMTVLAGILGVRGSSYD